MIDYQNFFVIAIVNNHIFKENEMDKTKKFLLKTSCLAVICGIYSSLSYAAPVLELSKSAILASYPAGSFLTSPTVGFSDDGRFLLVSVGVQDPASNVYVSNKVYDFYRNKSIDLPSLRSGSFNAKAISASGRYVLVRDSSPSQGGVIDLKIAANVNGLPNSVETLSDSGRYIGYTSYPGTGWLTHGYVYDLTTSASVLGTPKYGTDTQLAASSSGGFPSDILLSGDGKVFFWGTDGATTQFAAGKPNTRDMLAHKLGVGSTVNQRASNCSFCGDAVTNKGSNAYEYAVSADGGVAAFRSSGNDYGYTTSTGAISNGRSQLFARDLNTLKVDLISAADNGFIEEPAVNDYGYPSISSDGRFVVFSGGSQVFIRDRFAGKKQVLDATATKAIISGNGKAIVVERSDGWYSLPNPYLVTTTDFTSTNLFANIIWVGNAAGSRFDHMLLTANNLWTGYIDYSGSGSNSIRIDIGGQWSGASYVAGSSALIGYGDNNADGIAAFGEAGILLNQGAGRYQVTFNELTNQYTVKKLVNVNFNCYNGYTTLGQSVYITGNIPELGDWSPANAVKLNPTSYPTWTGALALPTNTNIEWKCIKRDELNPASSLVWEGGANNQFNPSSTQNSDGHF